jgi:hypothetical protein
MRAKRTILTAALVRELLDYDPKTGVFRWRSTTRKGEQAGSVAGSLQSDGIWRILVNGREYNAHRLAWLHVYGKWPPLVLNHINGDKADNRIANLREALSVPAPPCDEYACENKPRCKAEILACGAFVYYVRTGFVVKPDMTIRLLNERGTRMKLVEGECKPTREFFDLAFSDSDEEEQASATVGRPWKKKGPRPTKAANKALAAPVGGDARDGDEQREPVDSAAVTQWYPADAKPRREGVYETRDWVLGGWSYWTGDAWCLQRTSFADAARDAAKRPLSILQAREWRGTRRAAAQPDREPEGGSEAAADAKPQPEWCPL